MDDVTGNPKNSLQYGETEGSGIGGTEQHGRTSETLGGGNSVDREAPAEEILKNTETAEAARRDTLDSVRSELHHVHMQEVHPTEQRTADTAAPANAPPEAAKGRPRALKKLLTGIQEGLSGFVYEYLGDRSPGFVRDHVPVYRTGDIRYAGMSNTSGTSEWTIGSGARNHALELITKNTYDPNEPETAELKDKEYVAVKSTLGELGKHGDARVTHYGLHGEATKKKVVLSHTDRDKPVTYTVIKSNKQKS